MTYAVAGSFAPAARICWRRPRTPSMVATSLVKSAIEAMKDLDAGKVKDWAVDQIFAGACEDNCDQVREWVKARRDELAEVERERQRYVDQKTKPHGVIARRLAGER